MMVRININILRIAALILFICAAAALSSCDHFVESFLSEYTGARTSQRYDPPASAPEEETTLTPETTGEVIYVTVITPETAPSPETSGAEEISAAPVTTAAPETTAVPAVTDPPVPSEYADHVYLIAKDSGNCSELVGVVYLNVFLVNDTVSSWDAASVAELEAAFAEQEKSLEADAKKYGKQLDMIIGYETVSISVEVDTANTDDSWQDAALSNLGLMSLAKAQTILQSRNGGDSNPIVFAVNKAGRSYASWTTGSRSERVTLYSSSLDSLRHELCHLYGARDFYYPSDVEALANKHIANSLMCRGDEVDALTAYLIGWDGELDSNARDFLDATKHYTRALLEEEQSKQNVTGNVTDHALSYGTYTGYLERGVPNGYGKLIYSESGDIYEGTFENGKRHGTGKYTWPSGNAYEGDWVMGARTGTGTYIWVSGDRYVGDFVEGDRTGKGKYIWSDGSYYEGDFIDGVRTGQGIMHYASGSVYSGSFLDGSRHGKGTYTYAAGHLYVGDWVSGNRTGSGKMEWADGSSYEGEWLDNKRHGQGKYVNQYGTVFEGRWENDVFIS